MNAPATATVEYTPLDPRVGDVVTFTVSVVDPDADLLEVWQQCYGDAPCAAEVRSEVVGRPQDIYAIVRQRVVIGWGAYGPWTPPPALSGERQFTFTHVYDEVGDFRAAFSYRSINSAAQSPTPDPYGEIGSVTSEPVAVR